MQTQTATHTPGPWKYSAEIGRQHNCRLIYGQDGYLVTDAGRVSRRSGDEMDSNARLIAAAPDLLAACYSALHQIGTDSDLDDVTAPQKYKSLANMLAAVIEQAGAEIQQAHSVYIGPTQQ